VDHDSIEAQEEPPNLPLLQIGDLLALHAPRPFSIDSVLFLWRIVDSGALDDALDLPGRDTTVFRVFSLVDGEQFELRISEVLLPERHDSFVLEGRVFFLPFVFRSARLFFKATKVSRVKPPYPFGYRFRRSSEVSGRGSDVSRSFRLIVDNPFEAHQGVFR